MSSGSGVALVPGVGSRRTEPLPRAQDVPDREGVRLTAFAILALYGALRWETLLPGDARGRLLGLAVLAVALAAGGAVLARRSRVLAAVAAVLAVLAAFAIAGVPLGRVTHLRVAVTARGIEHGLTGLPNSLVPYPGGDRWIQTVIVLGAAILLLDSALLLAFAPRALGDARRAVAALPLVALVAVPATMVRPTYPYVEGLLLFAMLALFMWGDRVEQGHAAAAIGLCAIAAGAAMVVGPALDSHRPWLNPRGLAGSLTPATVDTFDWSQGYGPITWPRHDRPVLYIQAARGDYWKAENLDVFDGTGWTQGLVPDAEQLPNPAPAAIARWSQTIAVTLKNIQTSEVIGSGFTGQPTNIPQPVVPGFSPGTWTAGTSLRSGDSYVVQTYSPHPTPAELSSAGVGDAAATMGYRSILLPSTTLGSGAATATSQPEIVFPPFHSRQPLQGVIGLPGPGAALIKSSPYGPAYALARRLAGAARTPYAFAVSVQRLLATGYSYNESPPPSRYPIESFLFNSHLGYCQQFAGAMALLLRMGGVPARVAVGFTTGEDDAHARRWVVSDSDAHAWVEAWFPRYGWVRFEPTPPADPALGGRSPITSAAGGTAPATHAAAPHRDLGGPAAKNVVSQHSPGSGGGGPVTEGAALALAAIAVLASLALATRPLGSGERRLDELERAFARTGRPLAPEVTLASLEHRFRSSPEIAGYVRALRLERFGAGAPPPTQSQRRALRAELRTGLGLLGGVRALWALPPRRRSRRAAARPGGA